MRIFVNILIGLVALEHLWFLVLEMFLWETSIGREAFSLTHQFAAQTAPMAANQGLYNGFLAAGLLWSIFRQGNNFDLQVFFLSCVTIAGIFGAATVKPSIFFIQAFPAIITLVALYFSPRKSTRTHKYRVRRAGRPSSRTPVESSASTTSDPDAAAEHSQK